MDQSNVILGGTMPAHLIDIEGIMWEWKSARRNQGTQTLTTTVLKQKADKNKQKRNTLNWNSKSHVHS